MPCGHDGSWAVGSARALARVNPGNYQTAVVYITKLGRMYRPSPTAWTHLEYRTALESTDSEGVAAWTASAVYPAGPFDPLLAELIEIPSAACDEGAALSVRPSADAEPESIEWIVAEMQGLAIDPFRTDTDIAAYLDWLSSDYGRMGKVLFDGRRFTAELEAAVEFGVGHRVVLIDEVRLALGWRGIGGVGRVAISRMLRLFADSAAVVATIPFRWACGTRRSDWIPAAERVCKRTRSIRRSSTRSAGSGNRSDLCRSRTTSGSWTQLWCIHDEAVGLIEHRLAARSM